VDKNDKTSTEYKFNNKYNRKHGNRITPKKLNQCHNILVGIARVTEYSEQWILHLLSVYVYIYLPVIQSACTVFIVIWSFTGFTNFFLHYFMNGAIFGKNLLNITYVSVFIFCFAFQEQFSEIWLRTYPRRHLKYPLFLSYFNETWKFSSNLRKELQCQT
jgi:hypothetical protein